MTNNIGAHIETVAKHYWGEPSERRGHTLRWGNRGSKEVDLRKGTWFDFENNEGGGVVDLVRKNEGAQLAGIPDVLERKFGIAKQTQKAIQPAQFLSKVYNYVDQQGELRYQVMRYEPKTFRQRRPDGNGGWIYNMQDVEALPYNLQGILSRPDKAVFIVEGEKCADRLIELGAVATTSHGGAGKWRPELNKFLENRRVVVLPDADQAGQKHAQVVTSHLLDVAKEIKVVDLPGLNEKQDVYDWLLAGNTAEDLRDLVGQTEATTETVTLDGEVIEAEEEADVFPTYNLSYLRNMPPVSWLVDGLLTEHGFSIAYGEPGAGKSFLAIDLALSIAYGRSWHGSPVKQGAVLYIAGEGVGGLGKRIKAWQQHVGIEADAPMHVVPMAVHMTEQEDVEKLFRTIDSLGQDFSLCVIDTVARSLLGDENSSSDMGMFVSACNAVQRHINGAVLGIHHAGKDASRGMRGSSAITGAADAVLRVKKSEDTFTLKCEKQKDAEPFDEMQFDMIPIAMLGDSSIIIQRSDTGQQNTPRQARLTNDQLIALDALRSVLIKEKSDRCHIEGWKLEHRVKTPDLSAGKRRDARAALQSKRVIFIDDGIVVINKDLG